MSTIKSSREIQAIFEKSRRVSHPLVILLVTRTPEGRGPSGRVVFVAGKRLGNAVKRNRAKRVLREAVRRCGGPWRGFDVAVMARQDTGSAPASDLDRALLQMVEKAGLST
jgi:ribonuclease P protein component